MGAALAPALLVALCGQAPAQLRDDAVHGGEVLQRPAGQRAVELVERPSRGQRLGALDLRAFELAAQQRLEAAQLLAREALAARVGLGQVRLRLGAQADRAPDALHVDADDPRALALAPEGGDGQPREVAHRAVVAVAQRGRDLRAQRVEVELTRLAGVDPALLADVLAHGGRLGGAKEEALEDELEDPAVLRRLGQRRGERLAEVLGLGPADLGERLERVEQLAGAQRHALRAQLLAELEQPGGHARRAGCAARAGGH